MKIIEVRDGFILLEADESIYLSSFVRVLGMRKDYIAQINRLQRVNNIVIATAKILFVMMNDELFNYDKTEPMRDAEVVPFTTDILQNSIKVNNPVILGKTYDDKGFITVDSSAFDKKMLVSVQKGETNNILINNFVKQFSNLRKKTVIIDTNNSVNSFKYAAGKDFKLPLNRKTLQFLYKSCMDEATPDSKPLITEVFSDLAEYAETVPFVPFGVLKSIVDDMVDKQHILKLFVLKNRLSFLQRNGYFADEKQEADNLNKILSADSVCIDITKPDSNFQNFYIEYIYSVLDSENTQVLFEVSNAVSKRNLKMMITESEVPTAFFVNPKYRYLSDLKGLFDNFIIEPSDENNGIFSIYKSFLSSMPEGTYLIIGEAINYIPMISKTQVIDAVAVVSVEKEPETICDVQAPQEESVVQETAEEADDTEKAEEQETAEEADDTEESEEQEIPEALEEPVNSIPQQEEILANIEQKSEEVINSVAENLEEIQEIDLFDSEDTAEDEEDFEQADETIDSITDDAEVLEEAVEDGDIIEPEYTEVSGAEDLISVNKEDVPGLLNEPDTEDLQAENTEAGEITEPGISEELIEENPEDTISVDLAEDESPELLDELDELDEVPIADDSVQEETSIGLLDDSETFSSEYNDDLMNQDSSTDDFIGETEELPDAVNISDNGGELTIDDLSAEDDSIDDLDEIIELDGDSEENDIVIDLTEEDEQNSNIDEEMDRQIVEDVDKVFTTIKDTDELEEISDSDLDFIDELNEDNEDGMLEEYSGSVDEGILEQPSESIIPEKEPQQNEHEILEKRDSNTPIVPVYDADIPQEDMVVSDPIQQGDSVVHAKYGNGIVEKMIKYGTKTLFSINFENIGRRLLDPTLTEIKKL